jgi:amino acid transporter
MLGIPRRYSHFVFGIIQSGLTSLIAAGIASLPAGNATIFLGHWMASWLIAWAAMLPIVLLAAPAIRAFALRLTREERDPRAGSQA